MYDGEGGKGCIPDIGLRQLVATLHQPPVHHPPGQILHAALIREPQLRLRIELPHPDGEWVFLRQLVKATELGLEIVLEGRERLGREEVALGIGIRRREVQAHVCWISAPPSAGRAVRRRAGIEGVLGIAVGVRLSGPPGEAVVVLRRRGVHRRGVSVGGGTG